MDKIKLRLFEALAKLGYTGHEKDLFSIEYPDDPELRKLKLDTVVAYLDEQFRDPAEFIIKALKDEDEEVNKKAINLIKRLNDDRFVIHLLPFLEHNNSSLSELAVEVISQLACDEEQYIKPLIFFIQDEKKPLEARIKAIKSLRYENDLTIVLDAILSLITDSEKLLRVEASKIIKYITDQELILNSLLEKLLSDPSRDIELSILWAIANIKSHKIVEHIKPYLNHEDLAFQEASIFGIGNSGDDNSIEDLINKLNSN